MNPTKDPLIRRGLDESLEQFASRLHHAAHGFSTPPDKEQFRKCWALQGLRFLAAVPLEETWEKTVERIGDGARIAPGVPVPTRMGVEVQ